MQDKDGSESIDDCLAGLPDGPDDGEPADEFPADESSGIYHPEPYQSPEDLLASIKEDIQLAEDQQTQPAATPHDQAYAQSTRECRCSYVRSSKRSNGQSARRRDHRPDLPVSHKRP